MGTAVGCGPTDDARVIGAIRRAYELGTTHFDTDFRQRIGWWEPENFDTNVQMADRLIELAANKDIALSQLALACLLAQKD